MPSESPSPTVVVAAALYDTEGRLFAARRSAPPELAGRWELPGGKVEPGETPEHALVRGLREELGVEWAFPADPSAGRRARAEVRGQLVEWGLEELADIAALLVSELVTNSLRY